MRGGARVGGVGHAGLHLGGGEPFGEEVRGHVGVVDLGEQDLAACRGAVPCMATLGELFRSAATTTDRN